MKLISQTMNAKDKRQILATFLKISAKSGNISACLIHLYINKRIMQVKYIHNNQLYVITNHAVAANPLFEKEIYCKRFRKKMEKYLSPLCKIVSYNFIGHEFQIIVSMKSRKVFIKHYKLGRKKNKRSYKKAPHSTYIFSNAMAKLQSGLVAHFNWKEKRSGALFASRFKKVLIKNPEMLEYWIGRLKNLKTIHVYRKRWRHKVKGFRRKVIKNKVKSWMNSLENSIKEGLKLESLRFSNDKLQGRFKKPLKIGIKKKDLLLFLEIRHKIKIL